MLIPHFLADHISLAGDADHRLPVQEGLLPNQEIFSPDTLNQYCEVVLTETPSLIQTEPAYLILVAALSDFS
jgi:hypothetical protein